MLFHNVFMMIFVAFIHLNKSAADMTFSLRNCLIKSLKQLIRLCRNRDASAHIDQQLLPQNENNLDNNDWNSKVAGSSKLWTPGFPKPPPTKAMSA
jgi:hypothetical protein